jgi:hypothetical protein
VEGEIVEVAYDPDHPESVAHGQEVLALAEQAGGLDKIENVGSARSAGFLAVVALGGTVVWALCASSRRAPTGIEVWAVPKAGSGPRSSRRLTARWPAAWRLVPAGLTSSGGSLTGRGATGCRIRSGRVRVCGSDRAESPTCGGALQRQPDCLFTAGRATICRVAVASAGMAPSPARV